MLAYPSRDLDVMGWEAHGRASLWVCAIGLWTKPRQHYTKPQVSKNLLHSHHRAQSSNWSSLELHSVHAQATFIVPCRGLGGLSPPVTGAADLSGQRWHRSPMGTLAVPSWSIPDWVLHCRSFSSISVSTVSMGFEVAYPMGCAVARQAPTLRSLEHQHHPRSSAGIVSRTAQEKVPAWAGTGSRVWLPQDPSH